MEELMKSFLMVLVFTFLVAAIVLPIARPAVSASPKATAETLKQLEGKFMKAAAEKGSQGYMSYYADDSVEVPNGGPLIQGKMEIAKGMGFLDDKSNQLLWTPVGADISASGDLGYTYGTYEFHSKNKDGKPAVEYGKYTSIWKLQKDGSWKVVLDMGNSSPEPK
jgi:ketosteroid isomerase-like protein